MKKFFVLIFFVFVFTLSLPGNVLAGVDDFETTYFGIDYNLAKDNENRSVLYTTETIKANFLVPNQNHGVERALANSYDGHDVDLNIESITDQFGQNLEYSTLQNNDHTVVRVGNANTYVLGEKTYIISYTQRDVTKFFADANTDEFYWDTVGTQWRTPISLLDIKINIDKELVGSLNGNHACYFGVQNSNTRCELKKQDGVFSIQVNNVYPRENLTFSLGFVAGTFSSYKMSTAEKIFALWIFGVLVSIPIGVVLLIYLAWRYHRLSFRTKEMGTVIPEYLPPKNTSLTTATDIMPGTKNTFAAQLVDFAVRHFIQINETRPKSLFRMAEYEIVIKQDVTKLLAEEQEILSDIFGALPKVGDSLELKTLKNNYSVSSRMMDNAKKLKDLVKKDYDLRQKDLNTRKKLSTFGWFVLVPAVAMLNPILLFVAIAIFVSAYTITPLSDKGLDLARYLHGFKMYIGVAEQERLEMLQSPEGVLKLPDLDTNNTKQMIKLYEKTLPYAIIFGQEKAWNKELGRYYETTSTSPDWYHGSVPLHGAAFASAVSSFSSTTSYSAPSSSSSSGSSGGGFSGGGGGGGGGGGW